MQDGSVLNVACSPTRIGSLSPRKTAEKPNAGVFLENHLADERGIFGDETARVDVGFVFTQSIDRPLSRFLSVAQQRWTWLSCPILMGRAERP